MPQLVMQDPAVLLDNKTLILQAEEQTRSNKPVEGLQTSMQDIIRIYYLLVVYSISMNQQNF